VKENTYRSCGKKMRRKVMCSSRERIRMRIRVYGCTENTSGAGGGGDDSGGRNTGTKHSSAFV
jgi:hypothetical protein